MINVNPLLIGRANKVSVGAVRSESIAWRRRFWKLAALLTLLLLGDIAFGQAVCSVAWDSVNSVPPWIHRAFPSESQACHYADWTATSPSGNQVDQKTYLPGSVLSGSPATYNQIVGCNQITAQSGTPDFCFAYGCGISQQNNFFNISEVSTPCPQYFLVAQLTPDPKSCNCLGEPINPADGSMLRKEEDVIVPSPAGSVAFRRFYNSADSGGNENVPQWRHSYSASIQILQSTAVLFPYPGANSVTSPEYTTPSDACTQGFQTIKSSRSAWASATASYAGGSVCNITIPSGETASLRVYADGNPPITGSEPATEYDVIRDDGETLRFLRIGSSIINPIGSSLRLAVTSGGFTVTDDQDTVEQYDTSGKLQSITNRDGVTQTLTYNANGQLTSVVDSFGHSLAFTYDTWGTIHSITVNGTGSVQYMYGGHLSLSSVTHLDGTQQSYLYTDSNHPTSLTGVVDEQGITESTWTYDSQNRAIGTQEAGGANAVSLTYNTDGTVTTTDALGAVRTFSYDWIGDINRPTSITGSQCSTCLDGATTTYDAAGWVASRTDYNGNVTCYANDPVRGLELVRVEGFASGSTCPSNLAGYTPASGTRQRKISTTWNTSFREPATITETNRTTSFSYDASGNALTKTITDTSSSPNVSRTWTYTYNSYGQVLTSNGPRTDVSDVTAYSYYGCATGNECGQLHTVTNAANQTTTYNTYNAYGQPLTITDPNGILTTLTYDARQRLTSRQTAGETTTFDYWPTGLLKKVALPDASYVSYTYDDAHRLTQIADALGNKITYTLDAMGNHTAENSVDPANALHRTHTRVFNTLSQLWKDVNAAGTAAVTTSFGYDAQGNQTSVAAPLARNTGNAYDELNRLKQITDPASGLTQFGYDANDNLSSVTDPRGLTTGYSYNGFGDLSSQTSPDTGGTTNTYDSAGNLSTSTDARGALSTYGYDALNRVTSVAYSRSGSTDQTIAFTYDGGTNGKGHLTEASDANHSMAWAYDGLGRVTGKTQTIGTVTLSLAYAYTNGNLTTLTLPSGRAVTYGYNANHQITSISVSGSPVLGSVTYEPFGAVNGWTWGNGTNTVRAYDADGNVQQITSAGAHAYSLDNASRITGISDATLPARSWSYGYDAMDRLTSANTSTRAQSFTYDDDGNRLTQGGDAASTYTVASTSNRLNSTTGALARTYTYDAAGNTLTDGSHTFTYNDAGRMASVTGSSGAVTNLYTALGQRIRKATASTTTLFAYDEAGHLIGEYDGTGAVIQEIVWLGDMPVASVRTGDCGLSIFYIHTDHLNTPRVITRRTTSDVVWRWDGDPFGTDGPNENPSGLGTFSFNLRFPGQYYDAETGLNYNYFRDYDPAIGRYIESDPILRPSRDVIDGEWVFAVPLAIRKIRLLLPYSYVADQPIVGSDPRGLFWPLDFIHCLYYSNKYLNAAQDCRRRSGSCSQEQINFMAAYQSGSMTGAVLHCACLNAGPGVCQNMFESCGKTGTGAPKMVE